MNMNGDMRLARLDLGEGWIDLGYGEPLAVQDIFRKHVPLYLSNPKELFHSQYQPPQGNKELVDFLQRKYDAKVVVTNGGKQGIAAVMYALRKLGYDSCAMHAPYWVSTPSLITDAGFTISTCDQANLSRYVNLSDQVMFLTSPNNPDGSELSPQELQDMSTSAKKSGNILVHDAAYYTPIYAGTQKFIKVGDVQIYSFAKMYGLSGLRVGYVVVHNEALLPGIAEFVERSCSGVSTASQHIALHVERHFKDNPESLIAFEQESRALIRASRLELRALDPAVMEIEECKSNSMFAWGKVGPRYAPNDVKVNILDGELFGRPGYARMNIAVNPDLIRGAIRRLNEGRC